VIGYESTRSVDLTELPRPRSRGRNHEIDMHRSIPDRRDSPPEPAWRGTARGKVGGMRAAWGEFQLVAGWLPPGFDAGQGRVQYSMSPFVAADGTSQPPPTSAMLTVRAGDGESVGRQPGPVPMTVLFNLTFYGRDTRTQRLHLVAHPAIRGRLKSYGPPHWDWQSAGHREVLVHPLVHPPVVHPQGLDEALWEENGAEVSVLSQGVSRAHLLKFVAELRAIDAGSNRSDIDTP
jgi:hypothetical protein